jgi:hypothetical protein
MAKFPVFIKPVFKSKTIITFVLVLVACAAELFFGQHLIAGVDWQALGASAALSVAGIGLRLVTNSPVEVPGLPPAAPVPPTAPPTK